MKYTTTPSDLFQHLQMNAGIITEEFIPETGEFNKIIGATTGGISFTATPEFSDFGEDIDNVPDNMLELKKKSSETVSATGTFVSVSAQLAAKLVGAADIEENENYIKIVPRRDVLRSDFKTIWLIGDYSDINTGERAGYLAIKIMNALSTGGFQMQTTDSGKGNFAFELMGHYSLENQDQVPYEIYVRQGKEEPAPTPTPVTDPVLTALTIGDLVLTPAFDADVDEYTAATTNATDVITATAQDSDATVEIENGTTTVANGSAATWDEGENEVTITVKRTVDGTEYSSVYTVTVTKS